RLLYIYKVFAPAERNPYLMYLSAQPIALRWSAKHWLAAKTINIWLLWSQGIFRLVAILNALDLLSSPSIPAAGVAKLVYAPDSKSGEVKLMSVRVRPPAPNLYALLSKSTPLFGILSH